MWHKRNTQQHNETKPQFNFKRLQIISEIEQLYDKQDHMLFDDTEIVSIPLATREKNTQQYNFKHFTQWQKISNGKALQMPKHLEKTQKNNTILPTKHKPKNLNKNKKKQKEKPFQQT